MFSTQRTTCQVGIVAVLIAMPIALLGLALLARAPTENQTTAITDFAGGSDSSIRFHALTGLSAALSRINQCEQARRGKAYVAEREIVDTSKRRMTTASVGCSWVLYVWSRVMPLSRPGIQSATTAADYLDIDVVVVDGAELSSRRSDIQRQAALSPRDSLVADLIAAGATTHYPALLVYRAGRRIGHAILGYKTAEAYRSMIEERLHRDADSTSRRESIVELLRRRGLELAVGFDDGSINEEERQAYPQVENVVTEIGDWWRDLTVSVAAGAYFRWIPGENAIAIEAAQAVYLLDIADGRMMLGPGYIDFIPSPDGRMFVTPGRNRSGLEFYDASEVLAAAAVGAGQEVEPIYVDGHLRDHYPSVGVLEIAESVPSSTVYRVLTSWFDRVVIRDYVVTRSGAVGGVLVRPIRDAIVACGDYQISIAMLSQDGREIAGRDEAGGTTKIFRLADNGDCTEVVDLGLQTGKVAWNADGRQIAFAVPNGAFRDGSGVISVANANERNLTGIFVFDRVQAKVMRVRGSDEAARLTFPEFVGRDSIIFMIPHDDVEGRTKSSRFRLVCCL